MFEYFNDLSFERGDRSLRKATDMVLLSKPVLKFLKHVGCSVFADLQFLNNVF